MKHAIRRLEEERRALQEALLEVDGDPTAIGGLGAARALDRELQAEIEEIDEALELLRSCVEPERLSIVRGPSSGRGVVLHA